MTDEFPGGVPVSITNAEVSLEHGAGSDQLLAVFVRGGNHCRRVTRESASHRLAKVTRLWPRRDAQLTTDFGRRGDEVIVEAVQERIDGHQSIKWPHDRHVRGGLVNQPIKLAWCHEFTPVRSSTAEAETKSTSSGFIADWWRYRDAATMKRISAPSVHHGARHCAVEY